MHTSESAMYGEAFDSASQSGKVPGFLQQFRKTQCSPLTLIKCSQHPHKRYFEVDADWYGRSLAAAKTNGAYSDYDSTGSWYVKIAIDIENDTVSQVDGGTFDITDVTGTEKIQQITQIDGGFNFGLNFIAGFNYFFAERISIGAEINLGYLFSSTGGDVSDRRVTTPVSGAEVTSFSSSKSKASSKGFNVNSTGGLMLSFFF